MGIRHGKPTIAYRLNPTPKEDRLCLPEPVFQYEPLDRSRRHRPSMPGQLFARTQEKRHTAIGVNVGISAHRRLRSSRLGFPRCIVIREARAVIQIGGIDWALVAVEFDGEHLRYHDEVKVRERCDCGGSALSASSKHWRSVATWKRSGLCCCSVAMLPISFMEKLSGLPLGNQRRGVDQTRLRAHLQ